ncbi:MAG: SGNH/GDSL hydrolase family protein [Methanobrevibacter sp.]|nr:SGNH/GDSL hydrolase family protein [Methanobrevibacter sp.]
MFHQYPYTDAHELNLDWFLNEFKDLVADWEQFKTDLTADWNDVKNDWIALKNWVENYFANLDVSAEISAKLDAMLINGDLDAPIASAAGDWLSNNLATPSTPPIDTTLSVASAAADAKVVGDTFKLTPKGAGTVVSSLFPILSDADNADVNKIYTIAESGLVSNLPTNDADQGTLITYSFSDDVQGGNAQIYIDRYGIMYHRMRWGAIPGTYTAWALTSNGVQIKGNNQITSTTYPNMLDADNANINTIYTIASANLVANLPVNADTRGTLMTYSFSGATQGGNAQIYIDSVNNIYYRMRWGASPGTWQTWQKINYTRSKFSMFTSAAVIGDSFASGWIYVNGAGTEHYDQSWLQVLARANGISDAENYSKGGLTTATWLTNADGSAKMAADTAKQIYFVALGINDATSSYTLGTYADFTAGTHPATFYGNLGEIHDQIMAKNPDALVCWITCMRFTSQYTAYSDAIKDIATNQNELLIDSSTIPYLRSPEYTGSLASNHPTSYSYAAIADEIEKALSRAMIGNTKAKEFVY